MGRNRAPWSLTYLAPCRSSAEAMESSKRPKEVLAYRQLKRHERDNLLAALEATHWRISGPTGAAKLLGLRPTTLASKIKSLGLRVGKGGCREREA